MAKKENPTMTREQAQKIYQQLKKSADNRKLSTPNPEMKSAGKAIAEEIKKALRKDGPIEEAPTPRRAAARPERVERMESPRRSSLNRGNALAIGLVIAFAGVKVIFSALEATGIATATIADASMSMNASRLQAAGPTWSKEEAKMLMQLDARRAELEERSKKLDGREGDLEKRDREFAAKLTQLRELTDKLKLEREKDQKKRNTQLDQLANVYGSMNPQEAAQLMEQLDVTIALELIGRMPEKRIGQILALMSPERALSITRMLSGKN